MNSTHFQTASQLINCLLKWKLKLSNDIKTTQSPNGPQYCLQNWADKTHQSSGGSGSKNLTWVRTDHFFGCSGLVWLGKPPLNLEKNSQNPKFFPSRQKNIIGLGQTIPRTKTDRPLIYYHSKVCSVWVRANPSWGCIKECQATWVSLIKLPFRQEASFTEVNSVITLNTKTETLLWRTRVVRFIPVILQKYWSITPNFKIPCWNNSEFVIINSGIWFFF